MKPFDLRPILIYFLILIPSVLMIVLTSCKKELPPAVTTWTELEQNKDFTANYDTDISIQCADLNSEISITINGKTETFLAKNKADYPMVTYLLYKGDKYRVSANDNTKFFYIEKE
jgi:hypothetical protein